MKAFLAFLLIPLAMAGTMVLSIQFGVSQRYPILPALVVLTGLVLLALLIRKQFTIPRLIWNVLGWLLALLFGWYMFSYSEYGDESLKLAQGDTVAAQLAELELKTDDGEAWSPMTALTDSKATLLVFYRGFWWPYCIGELVRLAKHRDEFAALDTQLVAVSVDTPADTRKTSKKVGAPFTFVSDADGGLMDAFDLRHVGGGPAGDIARSASVLVDSSGQVLWMRVAENYRVRPAPEEVLSAVKAALEPKP